MTSGVVQGIQRLPGRQLVPIVQHQEVLGSIGVGVKAHSKHSSRDSTSISERGHVKLWYSLARDPWEGPNQLAALALALALAFLSTGRHVSTGSGE